MIIPVSTKQRDYSITVRRGAISDAGELFNLDRRVLIVTDSGVPRKYADTVGAFCKSPVIHTIPRGEGSKCFDEYVKLITVLSENGFTRHDCVVAVGGGVVGDLSGFAASTYMRGIDLYIVPTTLLSQLDSSVGGKTAINIGGVKNIAGTFYQPCGVLIDPDVLETLPEREYNAGLFEAVKIAATCDEMLFRKIENGGDIEEIITSAVTLKKNIVEADPIETGLRRVLNFGHTIGHAIESSSIGRLLHGECVALGMLPMCPEKVRERIKALMERYGLQTSFKTDSETLGCYIQHDKKMLDDLITAVFVDEIGSFRFERVSSDEIIMRAEAVL